jgi:C4-dicarboxylate-specific signal transduction histidine kinase
LSDRASASRESSYVGLANLQGRKSLSPTPIVQKVLEHVALRFPDVRFRISGEIPDSSVQVMGGEASLERILLNLLVNAAEGDGTQSSSEVELRIARESDAWVLRVLDDGPGFLQTMLSEPIGCVTTKPWGTGVGLFLVDRLVSESRGSLLRSNRPSNGADTGALRSSGAEVTLVLPIALVPDDELPASSRTFARHARATQGK